MQCLSYFLSKMVSPKFTRANCYMFMVFRFLGLAVFKLDSNYNPVENFVAKQINVCIVFLVVVDYFVGVKLSKSIPQNVEFMRQIQDGSMYVMMFVTLFTMVVEAFYKKSSYIKLLTTINKVDDTLAQFLGERRVFNNKVQMYKWWDNFKLLALLLTVILQQLLSLTVFVNLDLYLYFWLHIVPSICYICVVIIQIAFIVNAIAQRVSLINQILKLIEGDMGDVEILRHLIAKLKQSAILVSYSFGWTMVVIVLQNFISMAGDIFFSVLYKLEPTSYLYPFDGILHVVVVALMLLTLTSSCENYLSKVNETNAIINQAGSVLEPEIKEFSLLNMHETVKINANDFFNVDFHLLHSIFAATITYILILIQFQQ